jgi:hypothetical protein
MNVSNEQILAAAVGKAIAESVTPELTASVFTDAFKSFMEKPVNSYGNDKTTRAHETLQAALKQVLTERAIAFLSLPEQSAKLDSIIAETFRATLEEGKLQHACRDAVTRLFQNLSLR